MDDVISNMIDGGYIPSFCTGCYRKGRVGADFMDLAKPGLIKQFCLPNGLFTFNEYLNDFASAATKRKGKELIHKIVEQDVEDENLRKVILSNLEKIDKGQRDIYL